MHSTVARSHQLSRSRLSAKGRAVEVGPRGFDGRARRSSRVEETREH